MGFDDSVPASETSDDNMDLDTVFALVTNHDTLVTANKPRSRSKNPASISNVNDAAALRQRIKELEVSYHLRMRCLCEDDMRVGGVVFGKRSTASKPIPHRFVQVFNVILA